MTSFTLPIPTYQCHKRVQALRIKAVVENPRGYELHFEDERFCPIAVDDLNWYCKFVHFADANGGFEGGYFVIGDDGEHGWLPAAAFEAGYTLVEDGNDAVRQDASPAPLSVKVAEMRESNGRITWSVFLAKAPNAAPWDCHQVYSDAIEGRARYEAAVLAHFLGLGPAPDILAFDTDPPAEEVHPVGPAPDWSAWPGGPSEVEAALASRDAEIERLTAKLDELSKAFEPKTAPEAWLQEQCAGAVGPATQAAREVGK